MPPYLTETHRIALRLLEREGEESTHIHTQEKGGRPVGRWTALLLLAQHPLQTPAVALPLAEPVAASSDAADHVQAVSRADMSCAEL